MPDFYRELGDLFGVPRKPQKRWGGFKALRERWQAHIDTTRVRPMLLIDEAQEMTPPVLSELRLLGSTRFDSRLILSVVLAGDGRLAEALRHEEVLALGSRLRTRLMTTMAAELLAAAAQRELPQLDEKLYLEVFAAPVPARRLPPARQPAADEILHHVA